MPYLKRGWKYQRLRERSCGQKLVYLTTGGLLPVTFLGNIIVSGWNQGKYLIVLKYCEFWIENGTRIAIPPIAVYAGCLDDVYEWRLVWQLANSLWWLEIWSPKCREDTVLLQSSNHHPIAVYCWTWLLQHSSVAIAFKKLSRFSTFSIRA